MSLSWTPEVSPTWNEDKRRIVGASPEVFPALATADPGAHLPGHWWRVESEGQTVGYGWMDVTWGDAEVLLAVAPDARGQGIGTFIIDHLIAEAGRQGVRYTYNVIPARHPSPETLKTWLVGRGFHPSGDGLLKRKV